MKCKFSNSHFPIACHVYLLFLLDPERKDGLDECVDDADRTDDGTSTWIGTDDVLCI